ncbi:hypothetical protein [Pantoea ananatis]
MEEMHTLVKTILISETNNIDEGFKYDIYREDFGDKGLWYVVPHKQVVVTTNEGLHAIWVNIASKSFNSDKDIDYVVSQCRTHYRENSK